MIDQTNSPQSSEVAPVKSADDARQAVENQGVRYVLMWSLGSAIVLMAIVWYFFFSR